MPEHRLQKTRDSYAPDTCEMCCREILPGERHVREFDALGNMRESCPQRQHSYFARSMAFDQAERTRFQDLQMEHDESRTP